MKEIEVQNDVSEETVEYLLYVAKHDGYKVRFILRDTICPCCGKMYRNGCAIKYWNKRIKGNIKNIQNTRMTKKKNKTRIIDRDTRNSTKKTRYSP